MPATGKGRKKHDERWPDSEPNVKIAFYSPNMCSRTIEVTSDGYSALIPPFNPTLDGEERGHINVNALFVYSSDIFTSSRFQPDIKSNSVAQGQS